MRTITTHFNQDDLERVSVYLASKGVINMGQAFREVIGYLSLWNDTYPIVDIYLDKRDGEFQAVYRHKPFVQGDQPAYVIGAVFDVVSRTYGFHS